MKEGDTFWLHICKFEGYPRKKYIRMGETCRVCDWYKIPATERMHMNREQIMEQINDYKRRDND